MSARPPPGSETSPAPAPSTITHTPAQASAVARYQRGAGRSPANTRANSPANAGPEPMATTVPIATPVSATAAKKPSWYAATKAPESSTSRRSAGRTRPRARRDTANATSARSAAPTTMRALPTATGSMAGPRAWAVPVVPNRTAAMRTWVRARATSRIVPQFLPERDLGREAVAVSQPLVD